MEIQGKTSLGFKILVALLAPSILYWQDLALVTKEALNSDLSTYILTVPFLLAYILYRIRRVFAASTSEQFIRSRINTRLPLKELIGTLLCLLAYLISWFGSYGFQPLEYHIASLPLFVAGIILIIFNARTLRTLLFPIAFLVFLIPPPIELAQSAGAALSTFSSQAAYTLIRTMGLPVSLSKTYMSPVIFLKAPSGAEIPFAIDIACSGLYSLMGFTLFAIFTAYIARSPIHKKLVMLALGLPLIYGLNILRITLLVLIGYFFGPKLALNIFHLLGGWTLILVGTLVILTVAEKFIKIQIFKTTSETCPYCNENNRNSYCINCGKILQKTQNIVSKTDAVKITLILAITIPILLIQVPIFALTEGAAEVFIQNTMGEQTATKILPELEGYDLRFVYRDTAFENISGQDASLIYQYSPQTQSTQSIWVGLEIGPTKRCLHRWEFCLITWPQTRGWEVGISRLDLRDIHLLDNPPLSARYFAFQRKGSNYTEVILYWYTRSIFRTEEGFQQKWSKISVIEYTNNPQEYSAIEDELLPVAMAVANHWKPIITWSFLALAIAENGPTLITITVALLLTTLVFAIYFEMKKQRLARHIYAQISDREERQILKAVKALKNELAKEVKIASKYREISAKHIKIEELRKKLVEAKEVGLIEREIININDEPYITWKLNF